MQPEVYESASGRDNAGRVDGAITTNSVQEVAERILEVVGHAPAGLVTDVDGTISPISARPERAFVLPSAKAALDGLKRRLAVVAVVTGRAAADGRAMVGLDGITYIGNHGLEVWNAHEGAAELVAEARPWVPRLTTVLDEVARRIEGAEREPKTGESVSDKGDVLEIAQSATFNGVIIENKGATASLHYRLTPNPASARRELLQILARTAVTSGLRVEEGRMVINLLPPLTVTKGSAVTWLVREHNLKSIVYFGDDNTDAHAFRALGVLRQAGHVQTLGIGVVGPDTPLSVRHLADLTLPSVNAVAEVLGQVLDGLGSSDTMDWRAHTVGST